jgi:hypothetical protein
MREVLGKLQEKVLSTIMRALVAAQDAGVNMLVSGGYSQPVLDGVAVITYHLHWVAVTGCRDGLGAPKSPFWVLYTSFAVLRVMCWAPCNAIVLWTCTAFLTPPSLPPLPSPQPPGCPAQVQATVQGQNGQQQVVLVASQQLLQLCAALCVLQHIRDLVDPTIMAQCLPNVLKALNRCARESAGSHGPAYAQHLRQVSDQYVKHNLRWVDGCCEPVRKLQRVSFIHPGCSLDFCCYPSAAAPGWLVVLRCTGTVCTSCPSHQAVDAPMCNAPLPS